MKAIFFTFFACYTIVCVAQNTSQELYLPLEFRQAYEKGTRDRSGRVADGYWQNRAKYIIDASIDPETKLLEGKANITYFNNSPDTINAITFQSYHDYLKPYAKRFYVSEDLPERYHHEGFIIDEILIEKDTIDIENSKQVLDGGTNYTVKLNEPLSPQDSLKLTIEWNYVIPSDPTPWGRTGAIDSTSMFVAYWYPEIAVMDDIDGWDKNIFDSKTEFYHDFSDYDITITLPDNFTVWASVPPENPQEVYSPAVLDKLKQAQKSETAVNILTSEDFRTNSESTISWKYKAENFPDFSFALSDHYLWDASTYKSEEGQYFLQTAYSEDQKNSGQYLPIMHATLEILQNVFPKYPFPYEQFSSFCGLRLFGMEFPGMENMPCIGKIEIEQYLDMKLTDEEFYNLVLGGSVHEMAHMYLPFMVGVNEEKYAWMDEGFAMLAQSFVDRPWPLKKQDRPELGALNTVPLMVTSNEHENSWLNAYDVSSAAYSSLYNLLGRDRFLAALHAFMDEWKHKHPTPYDFMFFFNTVTESNLNWFWNNWFFDWGYIDLGIVNVNDETIEIGNKGGKAVSFKILMTFDDGEVREEEIGPEVWKDSALYSYKYAFPREDLSKVELIIPPEGDAVYKNNVWENKE